MKEKSSVTKMHFEGEVLYVHSVNAGGFRETNCKSCVLKHCGFHQGETPYKAALDFDRNFREEKP